MYTTLVLWSHLGVTESSRIQISHNAPFIYSRMTSHLLTTPTSTSWMTHVLFVAMPLLQIGSTHIQFVATPMNSLQCTLFVATTMNSLQCTLFYNPISVYYFSM